MVRKIITYRIPVSFVATFAVLIYFIPSDKNIDSSFAVYSILSGGLIFAAVFMATDHTTSPCTPLGQVIYGIGCGGLTVLLRYSGLFYDGVYPAVLIMNELARPIDELAFKLTNPAKKKKTAKKASGPEPGPEIVPDRQTGGDSGR